MNSLTDITCSCNDLAEVISCYNHNGIVKIDNFFTEKEINLLRQAYDEAVEDGQICLDDNKLVNCNDAVYKHPAFENFSAHPKIIQLIEKVFSRKGLELQHSKINSKPLKDEGEGKIKWHQDYPFFPHTNSDLIAFGIHLDDETEDSGPVTFKPGSHKLGVLSHCKNNEFHYECTEMDKAKSLPDIQITGQRGFVTLHHPMILHFSNHKSNNSPRRLLVYQYRSLDNVQLSGVLWQCTGTLIQEGQGKGQVRFFDGMTVENRGIYGRLYDITGKMKPDY